MSIVPPTVDWTLVPVRGKWVNYQRVAKTGRIIFTPAATRATDADNLTTIIGDSWGIDLVDGAIDTLVPATDDPDITPISFTYHIKEDFEGGSEYDIEVPMAMAATGVELSVASPYVVPSTGTPVPVSERVVTVPTGTTGWASQPDGTLWVEYTP